MCPSKSSKELSAKNSHHHHLRLHYYHYHNRRYRHHRHHHHNHNRQYHNRQSRRLHHHHHRYHYLHHQKGYMCMRLYYDLTQMAGTLSPLLKPAVVLFLFAGFGGRGRHEYRIGRRRQMSVQRIDSQHLEAISASDSQESGQLDTTSTGQIRTVSKMGQLKQKTL